jgi:CheY-like chemotaxis protein
MAMLRRLLPENISFQFVPGSMPATVNADTNQIEQVIVNLCVNARDAMISGGRLILETDNVVITEQDLEAHPWASPGPYVLLSVADTGVGMTREARERAFEPFFTTKPMHQGTGLGLSTVYGILRQHEGMVQVKSELGQGTQFKVFLPASPHSVLDRWDKIEWVPPRGQETILVAEDEPQVRRVVAQILRRSGYRVLLASNGMEAVQLIRKSDEPVHLAILDVVMPELGGPETWEQIRLLRPEIRVLFASGYTDERDSSRLPSKVNLLAKPFRMDELLVRIRQTLDDG